MKSILYVEDDAINALVMQKLLKGIYDIRHVVDGETCLALLEKEKFDLILMDINLGKGKIDGVETMHKIKENPATKNIGVITVTSYALPEDEERFLREGFDGYMAKPVDRKVLLQTLENFLD
jgi:CheY-like chemotaxis protein